MYRWVSWEQTESLGSFELNYPWWVSGEAVDGSYETIVCAIPTESSKEAEEIVLNSFDKRPHAIEWRFNSLKMGSPFSKRFPKPEWVSWASNKENEK